MTAIINLMGTQDIFDAIKCFVFELMTKNHIAINFMAHASGKNCENVITNIDL